MTDIFAAIRWWAILTTLGLVATPLTISLFGRLPDRGYAFTKMVGLLIVSYLFWIFGSLGFLGNNIGSILVTVGCLVGASIWLMRRQEVSSGNLRGSLKELISSHKTQILLTELVFALIFALWVWVRAQNPTIAATEKPMEFAFLNAVGRSSSFPPLDPWLSGFGISYYYFGYVMTSVIARLAMVPEPIAFNLAIAWLVAGTAVASFGLIYNLLALQGSRRIARVLGLVAAIAIPLAGNLEFALEYGHANGLGSVETWAWLDVRDFTGPAETVETPRYETSGWWWWRASRPIHEYHLNGRSEEGLEPIAEFPAFSFILGDLHPHVLALPFALLSLAVALAWWLGSGDYSTFGWGLGIRDWRLGVGNLQSPISNLPLLLFTILLLGGLSFLNTWDVLIHLFVVLGAFILAQWREQGWHNGILSRAFKLAIILIVGAILLYLPFYIGFRSQAGPPFLLPFLMRPTRLTHFAIIFGMSLWSIVILLTALVVRQKGRYWKNGLATGAILITFLLLLTLFFGSVIATSPEGAGACHHACSGAWYHATSRKDCARLGVNGRYHPPTHHPDRKTCHTHPPPAPHQHHRQHRHDLEISYR